MLGIQLSVVLSFLFFSTTAGAATAQLGEPLKLTNSFVGYLSLTIFVVAYIVVMMEEYLKLRKSKPVLLAAGLIWIIIGFTYQEHNLTEVAKQALEHNLLEYAELLLFLLVAMTYISAMEERRLFDALQAWMVGKGFNFRSLFWLTGILAFFISPIADNLTTALLMCAVVLKVAGSNPKIRKPCLCEYRNCGQCWRRIQPIRGYHNADGMAGRLREF